MIDDRNLQLSGLELHLAVKHFDFDFHGNWGCNALTSSLTDPFKKQIVSKSHRLAQEQELKEPTEQTSILPAGEVTQQS